MHVGQGRGQAACVFVAGDLRLNLVPNPRTSFPNLARGYANVRTHRAAMIARYNLKAART